MQSLGYFYFSVGRREVAPESMSTAATEEAA
jgi:hypothetical protein